MSKRLANRREKRPRKTAFVPLTLLACAGAGAGVIPVCVAGMAGCTISHHVDPAFNDYLDVPLSSGDDASDGGLGDVDAREASPGFDFVSDAASDAELDGARDASGVDR